MIGGANATIREGISSHVDADAATDGDDRFMLVFWGTSTCQLCSSPRQTYTWKISNGIYTQTNAPVSGLVRTVVSISHCGCDDPGSIPGLDKTLFLISLLVNTLYMLLLLWRRTASLPT